LPQSTRAASSSSVSVRYVRKKAAPPISLFDLIPPLPIPKTPAVYSSWTPQSIRVGAIGKKMGMTQLWDHWGCRFPVTVIRLEQCQVVMVRPRLSPKKGLVGIQVGAGMKKYRSCTKAEICHYLKAGILYPKQKLVEFPVSDDAVIPTGTSITARHFTVGQYLDVRGMSIGKGFQGAVKRYGFGGQPASHGVSLTHRSIGSAGSNQDPGRVWPGKRMAGHMGNIHNTQFCLQLYKIDVKRNLLFVKGSVPGNTGGWLEIRDAVGKKFDPAKSPPFPTYFPKPGEAEPEDIVMPRQGEDPFGGV